MVVSNSDLDDDMGIEITNVFVERNNVFLQTIDRLANLARNYNVDVYVIQVNGHNISWDMSIRTDYFHYDNENLVVVVFEIWHYADNYTIG